MDIVVKLRLAGGHCGQVEVTTARYRRKAPAQVKRDQVRSVAHKQQQTQRTVEPSTVEEDKQPCLSIEARVSTEPVEKKKRISKVNKSTAKPQPSKKSRSRKTEVNTGGDGDIEQLRYCGLTPEPSLNVSVMSLDSCISRPTPHSYMHVSDNSVYCLNPMLFLSCPRCVPHCSRRMRSHPWRIPM